MSRILLPLIVCCLSLAASGTRADGPAADTAPTLQLGTVAVTGERKVMETLRAIKAALRAPMSSDASHADEVVCRINKPLGEAREYLDCATNRDYIRRRDATQLSVATGTLGVPAGADVLRAFIAQQPEHQLHMQVQGGALQALLARIPAAPEDEGARVDAAPATLPAAATRQAPAAATRPDRG